MTRIFTCLVLMICLGCSAFAQSSAQDERNQRMLQDAAKKKDAKKVPTELTVRSNVNAQAVLIPRVDVNRIFGKEIANNYAVIQLIVGNKSSEAALIIHGIFIDYSRWALSGTPPVAASSVTVDGLVRERTDKFQMSTESNQIASEEYRVVRGQLLDAQMWSKRNWTVRLLTFAGSIAGAYAFSIKEKGFLKGIDAFSGVVVPGVAQAWPDGTVEQLNRVSDFGYQANKVIPQQGSEIIVCFFPIDRFLTPGFRRLFLRSPALFFSPLEMLLDRTITGEVDAVLGKNFGTSVPIEELRRQMGCYGQINAHIRNGVVDSLSDVADKKCLKDFGLETKPDGKIDLIQPDDANETKFKAFLILDYISQMSLNNVKVVVDGVMTLDTTTIGAKIESVEFDKIGDCDDNSQCYWNPDTGKGKRTGKIHGSYLTSGEVKINEAEALGIKEVTTSTEGSSDQVLNFSFKLTEPIKANTNLNFIVSKPVPGTTSDAKDPATKNSPPYQYQVMHKPSTFKIDKAELDTAQSKLTVTGSGFEDTTLVVTLHPPSGPEVTVKPTSPPTATSLVVDIPADKKSPGCWSVTIKTDKQVAPPDEHSFSITPTPKIETVKLDQQGNIVITGSDLVDTSACDGKELSFEFVKDGTEQGLPLTEPISKSSTKWTFPGQRKIGISAKGKVQVLLDKDVKDSKPALAPTQPPKKKKP